MRMSASALRIPSMTKARTSAFPIAGEKCNLMFSRKKRSRCYEEGFPLGPCQKHSGMPLLLRASHKCDICGLTLCKENRDPSALEMLLTYSRCIFQDDVDDWSTEASHMRDVYGQAACTIAATAAKNSDEGLFFERTPELLGPREIRATWTPTVGHVERDAFTFPPAGLFWCDRETIWTDGVERAPLSSRAWYVSRGEDGSPSWSLP